MDMNAKIQGIVARASSEIVRVAFDSLTGILGPGVVAAQSQGESSASVEAPKPAAAKKSRARKPAGAAQADKKPGAVKRTPEEFDRIKSQLLSTIQTSPGSSIEQIGKLMGAGTSELALPMKKLISGKQLSTTGSKRATRYFPINSTPS